eukprot:31227-Pelagococcus_subviridis.AAC.7
MTARRARIALDAPGALEGENLRHALRTRGVVVFTLERDVRCATLRLWRDVHPGEAEIRPEHARRTKLAGE